MFNRRINRIVVLACILALVPVLAFAQPRGGGKRGPHAGPPEGDRMGRMLDRLDVTDEQREQIEQVVAGEREQMQATVEQMRDAREALAQQIHAAELDEQAIRESAAALAPLEAELAVSRARSLRAIRGVLTPEQQAEMQQLMEQHRARMAQGPGDFEPRGPRHKQGRRGF